MIEEALGVSQHEAIEHYIDTPNASAYYRKAFEQYDQEEGFVSIWSWWAFIFGFVFLFYRKLYLEAYVAAIPFIATILMILLSFLGLSAILGIFSYLWLILGLVAIVYKKLYKVLTIYLILKVITYYLIFTHPIFILTYFALDGLFALYFVYQRYYRVLSTAQSYNVKGEEVLIALKDLGGVNRKALALIPLWIWIYYSYFYALILYLMLKSTIEF